MQGRSGWRGEGGEPPAEESHSCGGPARRGPAEWKDANQGHGPSSGSSVCLTRQAGIGVRIKSRGLCEGLSLGRCLANGSCSAAAPGGRGTALVGASGAPSSPQYAGGPSSPFPALHFPAGPTGTRASAKSSKDLGAPRSVASNPWALLLIVCRVKTTCSKQALGVAGGANPSREHLTCLSYSCAQGWDQWHGGSMPLPVCCAYRITRCRCRCGECPQRPGRHTAASRTTSFRSTFSLQ